MEYRREIDGLRAVAVIPVMLFHAGYPAFSGGFVGVDIFFVISGYLITSIIISEKELGTFTFAGFYERRVRRILPSLCFVMLVCWPFAWLWLLPSDMKNFSESIIAVTGFSSNFLFWRTSGYFDTISELKPLLHTWSLSLEEQYYALFPIFLIIGWKFKKFFLLLTMVLLAIASFVFGQLHSIAHPYFTFFLLPSRAWEFLLGALIAFFLASKKFVPILKVSELFSLVGILLIFYAVYMFDRQTPVPSYYTLIPTIGTALIIIFADSATFVGALLASRLLVGVGLISYSSYLWHQPLFAFARHIFVDGPNEEILGVLLIFSLILAYITWRFVEIPCRNKQKFTQGQVFRYGLALSFSFVLIGSIGFFSSGFSYRFTGEDKTLAELDILQESSFINKRFKELEDKEYNESGKRKVLIIGDSYAKDLVNAIFESELSSKLQVSAHFIDAHCGNLYLHREFNFYIEKGFVDSCRRTGWYDSNNLKRLLRDADEIWLSSSWTKWVATLLPESVRNLTEDYNKRVLVFGGKDLGRINIKKILSVSPDNRQAIRNRIPERRRITNMFMSSNLPKDVFVDVSYSLCGDEDWCRIFDDQRNLLSPDGGHLTVYGARLLGKKLSEHPLIRTSIAARYSEN